VSRAELLKKNRLESAGRAAVSLIDTLIDKDSKDCPVAATLTDADRAKLVEIKRRIAADEATQNSVTSDAAYSP
jgi:hypothetical protein